MKKCLMTLLFIISSFCSQAQLNSYKESKEDFRLMFDLLFNYNDDNEEEQIFVLSARDDYEVSVHMGTASKVDMRLDDAFELAECHPCVIVSEEFTKYPLNYIFDIIEYQDVFLVTQEGDKFKVIRYQPKEEEE